MARPTTWYLSLASVTLALTFSSLLRAQDPSEGMVPAPAAPAEPGAPAAPGADTATGPVQDTISFQTFYDDLAPMGTWIQTNDYGYVWQPNVTDPNWAPYTLGHWAYTDDGWTWMSDEAFGWATYHYGRWANLQNMGWVWVPGYVWAPAWVSWRTNEDTVGWAPLPPDSMAGVDYAANTTPDQGQGQEQPVEDQGYAIGSDVDEYYGIGPGWYVFLPIGFVCWHDYHGHWCDHHDNWWNCNHTHNVTNTRITRHGQPGQFGHVHAGGPDLAAINAKSQKPIQQLTLTRTKTPGNPTLNGNTLSVFAPRIGTVPATGAKPQNVGSTIGEVAINRGSDVTQPLLVNSHLKPNALTQEEIAKVRQAQNEAPAAAKVMNDGETFGAAPRTTLTTMKPIVSHASAPTFNTQGGQMQVQGQRQFQGQGQIYSPQQHGLSQQNALGSESTTQSHGVQQQNVLGTEQNNSQKVYQPAPQVYQQETHTPPQQQQQGQVFTPAPSHSFIQQQQQEAAGGGGGAPVTSHQRESSGGYTQQSQPVVHQSAPVVHESAPAPVTHQSAPTYSAPAQSSGGGGGSEHGSASSSSSSSGSSSGGSSNNNSSSGGGGGGSSSGGGFRSH